MAESQGNQAVALGGKLRSLELSLTNYKRDTVINMRPFVADVTIYENIFNPTLHGVMTVVDSIGFLSGYGFPILGEEYLTIKYSVPDDSIPARSLDFFVYKMAPVFNAENFKHKRYILYFCSIEQKEDASRTVQKAYNQPNSDTVKNILSEYMRSKKTVETQPTKGAQAVIIPNLSPLAAVDFLRRRSIAQDKYNSASYLFFETTDGFKFCDIEYLIDKGRDKIKANAERYTYYLTQTDLQRTSTGTGDNDNTDPRNYNKAEFKSLFSWSQDHRGDTIEKLKLGMFSSKVNVFDPVNVVLSSKIFYFNPDKTTTMGKFPENSKDFITDMSLNLHDQFRLFTVVKDPTAPDTFLDDIVQNSASYMTRLAQNMFAAKIIGDPSILAGDIITIPNLPAYRNPDGKGNDDKLLTGEFLICGITHKFGLESYAADLELYKNGFSADPEKVIEVGK